MSFVKKIIAFDLDGTLTESRCLLTEKMADLLKDLCLKTKVAIISGSSFNQFNRQFFPTWQKIQVSKEVNRNLIILPTSGSQHYEFDEEEGVWKQISSESFDPELKNKIIEDLEEVVKSFKEYDLASPEEKEGEYIEDRGTQISLSALGFEAPIEKKSLWDPDHKKREKIIKEKLQGLLSVASVNIGGTTTIDVLPKDFDKAKGLKILLEKMKLEISDIIFVGDSVFPGGNDYPPLLAGIESIKVNGPEDTVVLIKKWLE